METILPYIYGFIPGVMLGAISAVLWARKHPKIVEAAVAGAKTAEAAAQAAGKKAGL